MLDITLVLSLAIAVHSNIKMEHVGTLPETNDILSPRIKPLFGKLSPPAEKEEECHFCLLQDNFWCSNYRAADTTLTQNVSRPGHRYLIKNKPCAAPIVEQHINTNTHASFACKNTPEKTQLYNVLPQKSSHRTHNRSHNSTLTPNLRSLAGMWTTHWL